MEFQNKGVDDAGVALATAPWYDDAGMSAMRLRVEGYAVFAWMVDRRRQGLASAGGFAGNGEGCRLIVWCAGDEAIVRGCIFGLLTVVDYCNLCQCETLDDIRLHPSATEFGPYLQNRNKKCRFLISIVRNSIAFNQ
ncbi:hypothetical protein U1Q18_037261 [Sarracenia purpurea var. burkii]